MKTLYNMHILQYFKCTAYSQHSIFPIKEQLNLTPQPCTKIISHLSDIVHAKRNILL